MRVLVCGDRRWSHAGVLVGVLDRIHRERGIDVVIEGEARGADTMAAGWAENHGVRVEPYPASWARHGRAAGPIRNRRMLEEGRPELVVAFHDDLARSKGTLSMVALARKAGVPVEVYGSRRLGPREGVESPPSGEGPQARPRPGPL